MRTSIPLLIASDSADDAEQLKRHLKGTFHHHGTATDISTGGEFIKGREDCIIAVCFTTLKAAQDYYTSILRYALRNKPIRHRTVLLCSSGEVHEACNAVTHGRFDEFVVFKPLVDPCVLRFQIYRQARALETEERVRQTLGDQQLKRSRRITDEALESMREEQRRMLAEADAEQEALRRQLTRRLEKFEEKLGGAGMADAVKVLDEAKLKDSFRSLTATDLEEELSAFRAGLAETIDAVLERYKRIRAEAHAALDALAPDHRAPTTVLVVDDEQNINDTMREMLEVEDYQVIQAFDGDNGFFHAVHHLPDLVLIDVNMPKLGGIDLARKLQAHDKTRHIPMIIVTGNATRNVVESGRRAGVRDFLVKPFTYETLMEKVASVLKGDTAPQGDA